MRQSTPHLAPESASTHALGLDHEPIARTNTDAASALLLSVLLPLTLLAMRGSCLSSPANWLKGHKHRPRKHSGGTNDLRIHLRCARNLNRTKQAAVSVTPPPAEWYNFKTRIRAVWRFPGVLSAGGGMWI